MPSNDFEAWLPPGLLLDQDMIGRLFHHVQQSDHGHLGSRLDHSTFLAFTHGCPQDDLQLLLQDYLQDRSGLGLNSPPQLAGAAISSMLTRADLAALYVYFAKPLHWTESEFRLYILTAAAAEFLDFLQAAADSCPDFSDPTQWNVIRKCGRLLRARGVVDFNSDDLTLSALRSSVRCSARNILSDGPELDLQQYLRVVFDFATTVLPSNAAIDCLEDAADLFANRLAWEAMQREAEKRRPRRKYTKRAKTDPDSQSAVSSATPSTGPPSIATRTSPELAEEAHHGEVSSSDDDSTIDIPLDSEEPGVRATQSTAVNPSAIPFVIAPVILNKADAIQSDISNGIVQNDDDSGRGISLSSPVKAKTKRIAGVSRIPNPPLSSPMFGLIQENLASNPFHLILAVVFLNKTKGTLAIPIFRTIIKQYPTPADLAVATLDDLIPIIRHLGFQNKRAKKLIAIGQCWNVDPPQRERRHRTRNYPLHGAHRNIKKEEILKDSDSRVAAFEIAHVPGTGDYAWDSWRIFCRDRLRGLSSGWNGQGSGPLFQPEWKRVLPRDKELRAFLRWMWLKEGWAWDPLTGEKEVAPVELMAAVEKGGYAWDQND